MPSVEQVLRDSGFTDDQIAALDQRAVTAFGNVLSTAEQAQRSNVDFYENRIVPSLTQWDEEKQRVEREKQQAAAEVAYYRTLNPDAPAFNAQSRDQAGRYVAGAPGGTPGSPTYTGPSADYIEMKLGNGLSNVAWAMQTYQQLNPGEYLPDSFDKLSQQAHASGMPFRQYVETKYNFAGKRAEQEKQRQEKHDADIAAKAVADNDRKWAERTGSNPDVRMSMQSPRMTEVARATRAGKEVPGYGKLSDPLLLDEHQRRQQTRATIHNELSERES